MSHPTDDIKLRILTLFSKYMKDKFAAQTLSCIGLVMHDSEDRGEFVREMQKWLASS